MYLCPSETVHPRYLSGAKKINANRTVSYGTQTYETDSSLWPLNQPMPKLEALVSLKYYILMLSHEGESLYPFFKYISRRWMIKVLPKFITLYK